MQVSGLLFCSWARGINYIQYSDYVSMIFCSTFAVTYFGWSDYIPNGFNLLKAFDEDNEPVKITSFAWSLSLPFFLTENFMYFHHLASHQTPQSIEVRQGLTESVTESVTPLPQYDFIMSAVTLTYRWTNQSTRNALSEVENLIIKKIQKIICDRQIIR